VQNDNGLANLQVLRILRHEEGKAFRQLLGILVADTEDDVRGGTGYRRLDFWSN
jgi:hypothetical protein